ncbi:methylamine utilization protein [Marinobacter caseinilyticus]|uniref:methylamine utilization protein n=1 Tax=Marinobacter caseinilyticus TaxID=2692195 RepID=UPI001409D86E|nr:methylamine utilization protein [Marinobacter caseinilyticus]
MLSNGHFGLLAAFILALGTPLQSFAGSVSLEFYDQSTGKPLPGVVVTADNGMTPSPATAEMAQQQRAFAPHVLIIPQDTTVSFPNRDNTQHHVYSFSKPKPLNIELYAGQPEAPIRFDKTGIVELGCNIHDNMQGFIVVTDKSQASRSGDDGISQFELPDDSLEGGLNVEIWHPRLRNNTTSQFITLTGPFPITQTLTLDVMPEKAPRSGLEGLQKRFRDL